MNGVPICASCGMPLNGCHYRYDATRPSVCAGCLDNLIAEQQDRAAQLRADADAIRDEETETTETV